MPEIPMHLLDAYKDRRKLTKELHSIGPFIRDSVAKLKYSCRKKNYKRCQNKPPQFFILLYLTSPTLHSKETTGGGGEKFRKT